MSNQLQSIDELTDEWAQRGIKLGWQYGALTNEIHKGAFEGMTVQQHKALKAIDQGETLRDHMTSYELAFSILGEARARDVAREENAQGFDENEAIAKQAGQAAGAARRAFEAETGRPVISDKSHIKEIRQRKRIKTANDDAPESTI